jgi:formylglycine-generating enzyme required for sulfatase activity
MLPINKTVRLLILIMLVGIIAGLAGWITQTYRKDQLNSRTTMLLSNFRPYVLTKETEAVLKPGAVFRECAKACPEMIIVPSGSFMMGSPEGEKGRHSNEGPQRKVTIAQPFAISRFAVTFADWDACVFDGGCLGVGDAGWGRGTKPAIYVTWHDAKRYVAWLSRITGQPYRLLSEAEWEYAARAGAQSAYFWGDEIGRNNANCNGCGSIWDNRTTSPVGSFKPNAFGLYDMHGNVRQWVEDCFQSYVDGMPADGSARTTGDCFNRVLRGGSWWDYPGVLRSASRLGFLPDDKNDYTGFRVARALAR